MRVDESQEPSGPAEQRRVYVPWTLGDVAMGIGLVIGVAIVVTVGMVIGTIVLVGPALLDSDLSGGIEGLLGILAAEGLLQTWLLLLMVAMMAGEGAMLFSAWLFGALKYRCGWRALGFRSFRPLNGIALALTVVLAGLVVGMLYDILLGRLGMDAPSNLPAGLADTGLGLGIIFVLAVIVAPIAEETFFRGFVLGGIARRFGRVWGVLLSALLFSVAHMEPGALLPIFVLGLLLGWLYLRTGSIWPCILTHFAYNSIAMVFVL